jgi:hypothetical protein
LSFWQELNLRRCLIGAELNHSATEGFEIGRADGNRTRVSGVTDQCNNHYTTALFEILLMYLMFG